MTGQLSLRQRATLVEALSSSLEHGGTALGTVPKALRRLLEEEAWREFTTSRGEHVTYERFADFIVTPPLKGLGSDVALVERIVAADDEATQLLREALKEKPGPKSSHDNIMRSRQGTSRPYTLRRLKRDAPELHAEVLAGRLSAHGAMVRAGFQPKTVTVPITRPEAVARSLLKYMSADDIAKLIAVLVGAADLSANQEDGTP
jgi:hypothetical protein